MSIKLDPWGHFAISDYEKLFENFGIKPITDIIDRLPKTHYFFTRKIIFGHRDMDKWLDALKRRDKTIVLTGFMPSGHVHLGHLMVIEELKYLQSIGVDVKIVIADAEAYVVRRIKREKTIDYGLEYIAHAIAWGLDPKKTKFYFQTMQQPSYYRLIQMFSRKISLAEMEAIYGDLSPGKIVAALTQASDILHPQLEEYGGYKYVLVPVGADQDPHIRLTRDLADRFSNDLGLERPSSMYHKFIIGLDGNKMSSSRPEYAIFLLDDLNVIKKKVYSALTGGRATAEEQRRLGGEPYKCSVYQLYMYFLYREDRELLDLYKKCTAGEILCGECKRLAYEKLSRILEEQKKRYFKVMESGILEKIVEKPSF
ncbi:MAG: tryptophan--tRNA ligase [Desulfurococcales archaeon ex4484_58]|nr:MAG: tryptophan--tRNA ligase [Desulfurococcales archaeon ex4484_58]